MRSPTAWSGVWIGGGSADGRGYVYVVDDNNNETRFTIA
jgi:hypothetical protein